MFKSLNTIKTEIFNGFIAKIQPLFPGYSPDINEKNVENALSNGNAPEVWNAGVLNEKIRRQDNPLTCNSITEQPYGTLEEWGKAKLGRGPFLANFGRYQLYYNGFWWCL